MYPGVRLCWSPVPDGVSEAAGERRSSMSKSGRKLSLEAAMQRLDAIVEAMESGQIGIEDSIARYEEAMALASHCRQILDQAEQRVRKIQLDAAGQIQTTPLERSEDAGESANGEEGPGESAEGSDA